MFEEDETPEDNVLELTEEQEVPEIDDTEEVEEPEVSFADEEEEEDAPDLPKRLRSEIKERDRRLIAQERELEELRKKTALPPVEVGPKPKLEDFDYDEEKWEAAVDEWSETKVKAALQARDAVQDNDLVEEARADVQNYQQGVTALPYADAKEIIKTVAETLPESVQYTIAAVAKDPATLTYALGKHPQKLKAILDIKNPTKQIAAIVRMEAEMRVSTGRKPPEPDRPLKGNAGAVIKPDKNLEKLHAEAQRTGDYSKYFAAKRANKAA